MTFINERKRLTVEVLAADCIDVGELSRNGLLKEPKVSIRPGLRLPDIEKMSADRYVIVISLHDVRTPQYVHLSWTPCHFGSERPWMLCPHCRKRVARLFKGMGGYFCRGCIGNPPYESQLRNEMARVYLRVYRLRQRIGGGRPVTSPIPERPYRMWRKTYNRIVAEIQRLESSLIGSPVVKSAPLLIRPLSY